MKVLKIIGIVLLALIGLFLLLGIIAPNKISTERSIVVDAPPEVVYDVTNDLATWDAWSPWKENDPTIATVLGEQTAGVGASSSWTSENSGSGSILITGAEPHERVAVETSFDGMGSAQTPFSFEPADKGTKVTWKFDAKIPYPWNAFSLFQPGEEAINKDYERGLELLKTYVETQAPSPTTYGGYEIQEKEMPVRYFATIRNNIKAEKIQETYARDFGKLMKSCESKGIEPAGMPCGMYYNWDEANGTTDMASCIPIEKKANLGKGIEVVEIPACKTLVIDYYGGYEQLGAAHEAMDQYLADNGLTARLPVYEEYVTDPESEPDPSKWLTRIYYPVQ